MPKFDKEDLKYVDQAIAALDETIGQVVAKLGILPNGSVKVGNSILVEVKMVVDLKKNIVPRLVFSGTEHLVANASVHTKITILESVDGIVKGFTDQILEAWKRISLLDKKKIQSALDRAKYMEKEE